MTRYIFHFQHLSDICQIGSGFPLFLVLSRVRELPQSCSTDSAHLHRQFTSFTVTQPPCRVQAGGHSQSCNFDAACCQNSERTDLNTSLPIKTMRRFLVANPCGITSVSITQESRGSQGLSPVRDRAGSGGGGHAMTSSPPKPTSDTLIKTKTQLFISGLTAFCFFVL